MLENLHEFKRELVQQNVFFCFSGLLSQSLLVEIGNSLRRKMLMEKTNFNTTLRVFSILIEQVQNILRYSAEKVDSPIDNIERLSGGVIVIENTEDAFYVLCGNVIHSHDTQTLYERLNLLQNMDKKELKSYYKQQRRQSTQTQSKGAGLGFIELARNASAPLEFHFQPIDDKNTFFSLKTKVSK